MRINEHPILEFPKKREVSFVFEGETLKGYEGEPIASALHANGVKVLRHSPEDHRARGFFLCHWKLFLLSHGSRRRTKCARLCGRIKRGNGSQETGR